MLALAPDAQKTLFEIAQARRALRLALNMFSVHHPEALRRASEVFFWANAAVREGALTAGDAERVLLELATRTALLPAEFVICAMLFHYRVEICDKNSLWDAQARRAVAYYIESYIYHKKTGGASCT